jgi:hypothetical protein
MDFIINYDTRLRRSFGGQVECRMGGVVAKQEE